ncbi:serine/threonine protein kinase [bacterium]|nr:serine/threonine protein kinase [bacterium]
MLNDKKATELFSKSIDGELTETESNQLEVHLSNSEAAKAFAVLAKTIDKSIVENSGISESGDGDSALSQDAKNRMSDSILRAMEKNSNLAATLLDSNESPADQQFTLQNQQEIQPGDSREASSPYTIVRKLGEGGLGNVWLARDEKLNRNVAIKEMNSHALQSPKAWQRFEREAEITGQLEHPNVVSLYQYGTDRKTGEPFYSMRFVGKRTLADAITEYHDRCLAGKCDPLILHRLLTAFLGVCQAIAYAHSRGVIHRDLKPENIGLDNFGQVMVLDWGLAKVVDDSDLSSQLSGDVELSGEALAETLAGEVIGTPLFMSPEQAAGESVSQQADIYGLGAILFAILTGDAPHEPKKSKSAEPLKIKEVLKSIQQSESPRPRDFRADIPIELEAICMKAMAFKKYARHDTASELANDVERWMVNQGQRQSEYETMRMEGRELRTNTQASVRDLETNVRFMANLPPIQELIRADSVEETTAWRDRLITIFSGLLRAKSDYRSIVYSRLEGDEFTELVRVERHSTVHSNIRSIPKSRLRSGTSSEFIQRVGQNDPDEVYTSLACGALHDAASCEKKDVTLFAGVPIFDSQEENLYGVVIIECDLDHILKQQLNRRFIATDIIVACDTYQTILHSNGQDGIVDESVGKTLQPTRPELTEAITHLQEKMEYIDTTNQQVYGARLWLNANPHGIMFLLSHK